MSVEARIARALLRLYPAEFRRRWGRAMAEFHHDRLRHARALGEPRVLVWLRIVVDTALSALAERLRARKIVPLHRPPEDPIVRTLLQDARFALRDLVRRPAFTAVVLATLALGVGANAAIFSVVNGVLLRPLPYPHAERVVAFGHEPPHWLAAPQDFLDYRRELRSFEKLAAYTRREDTLTGEGDPERVRFVPATEDFFPLLGVAPLLGRTFLPEEFQGDAEHPSTVAVLSHALWKRRFGGDRSIIGKSIHVNGLPRTVVGVMPAHFDFPEARTDMWGPMPPPRPDSVNGRTNHFLFMVGRLRAGATIEQAMREATALDRRIMRDEPQHFDPAKPLLPHMEGVREQLVGPTRPYLLALLGAVGFVLLIACANVGNLLLARGESRRKEMALRNALGASTRRLVTQLLTESLVLAVLGGVVGAAGAWGLTRLLRAAAPDGLPRVAAIGLDWRVALFTLGIVAATGLLIGLVPAWRLAPDAAATLKEGGRGTGPQTTSAGARRALVAAEVALAVVMLSGAGMLLRSLAHLRANDLGFVPQGVLTAKVSISRRDYDDARTAAFFSRLIERLRAVPGVRAVGASGWLPVVDAGGLWGFQPEGGNYPDGRWPSAVPQQATPGYLAAIGLPLLAGRDFTTADAAGAPLVAIVSERFAKLAWPGQDAVGRRFQLSRESPLVTVVGVVGDIRSHGFDDTPEQTMYFPHAQAAQSAYFVPRAMAILLRTSGDPARLAPALRAAVRELEPTAPVSEIRTLNDVVATSVASRRFSTALLSAFAALALLLAGVGTYGVISYGVSQRAFELGLRMALGAERRTVLGLVLREGLRMCGAGLAAGLVGSVLVARAIRAMLVGVSPVDLPTLGGVCAVLLGVAVLASLVPARRAMGVDPTEALRG
ncbi:permease [Gemmatirosa kalamazoonensis]|uniref:Permease n=1 Tax=Gemmatirosa kalamazoonensis TaxID=861299 RepID=W0RAI6_9BACT|nr:ABC transporter permease [Gemmatirosa kalamazoonensis]AHG88119.1 permease [Gemmatirosa kalamazoonensis]